MIEAAQLAAIAPAVGARIRLLRLGCGMTQAEAGRRADMAREIWARVESGRHMLTLEVAERCAIAVGADVTDVLCAVDELLGLHEQHERKISARRAA